MNQTTPATDPAVDRVGVFAALGAFGFWGIAPIYFKFVNTVPPIEIMVHRVLWTIPLLALVLYWRHGARNFMQRMRLPGRTLRVLVVTSLLVGFNWLVFVYAVVNDQVLATSLGYFINPLVNVLLGMVFLGERLNQLRLIAVVLAALGTTYLGIYLGQPPWLALSLAFSFGFYGLIRKRLGVTPMVGLLWEALIMLPLALGYIYWALAQGRLHFLHQTAGVTDVLLLMAGLVTVIPLVSFNTAAQRLSLTVLGFFQYLAPSLTFTLAVVIYGEPFTHGHQVAFACIWSALLLVSVVPVWQRRRVLKHQ